MTLRANSVGVTFGRGGIRSRSVDTVRAVDDVTLSVDQGERLGLVGESGCGKSTMARVLTGLVAPTDGEVLFEGHRIGELRKQKYQAYRRACQLVFQDPSSAFDPRQSILKSVSEPLAIQGKLVNKERRSRALQELERVGLDPDAAARRPGGLSGGQLQRAAIARALVLDPRILILDEAVSSLDLSVQAQVLRLIIGLQAERDLGYLFISHDIAVIGAATDTVAVMYEGRVIEQGPTKKVLSDPEHPYTAALLLSVPQLSRPPGTPSLIDRVEALNRERYSDPISNK